MFEKYSVLMSVYFKENPEYLHDSMDSMFRQTIPPDEFVLVCDGPLGENLNAVIHHFETHEQETLKVIRLPENAGLGKALQAGLEHITNSLVARMDSDDLSLPGRCEKQLSYIQDHPETSILGGAIAEFQEDPDVISATRAVPENHEEIVAYSKSRNPFNHVSVMFRKEDVQRAGGYLHMPYLEDYYLWIRMLMRGCLAHNLKDVLVNVRIGNGMTSRRSGFRYARAQADLFSYMRRIRYISATQHLKSVAIRMIFSFLPDRARQYLYLHLLRS